MLNSLPSDEEASREIALQITGLSRWKWHAILLESLLERPKRFSELRKAIPTISVKVLAQNLKRLEMAGLLVRLDNSGRTKHVVYRISEPSQTLRAAISAVLHTTTIQVPTDKSTSPERKRDLPEADD